MQLRAMRTSLVIALLYWLCAVAAYVPTRSARTAVRAERGMEVLYDLPHAQCLRGGFLVADGSRSEALG